MEAHTPRDYQTDFYPDAYLNLYYSEESMKQGTRVSLFALPNFATIIRMTMKPEERQTLLDVGAGPTVYAAFCFRDTVDKIFLTDYVHKNLDVVKDWVNDTNAYDWTPTINVIRRTEGGAMYTDDEVHRVEDNTRRLVKAGGVLWSNVHDQDICPDLPVEQVDIMVSVFCLESACSTYHEYCTALENMMRKLRSGGRFVLGSVLDDDNYNSGRSVIFKLLRLSEEEILKALDMVGLDGDTLKKYVLEDEGVMFLIATKK